MTTKNQKREEREPDIGASIFAGAILCLAVYGGYKLFQKEVHSNPALGSGIDSEILNKIVDQELRS